MRTLLLLGTVVGLAQAQELNPPHPAAAKRLADTETCLRFARDCGEHLLRRVRPTEHGLTATSRRDVYGGDAGVALLPVPERGP
ncbi:MAG: hypothetical protein ACYS0K_03080 [Planctomycetota bacterium]|jgi:hypothetical protein